MARKREVLPPTAPLLQGLLKYMRVRLYDIGQLL